MHYRYTAFGGKQPEIIQASLSYEQNLRNIRKIKPVAIIPCTDNSIELALRLSKDLNLPSSPYENFPKMRDKLECQKALKEYGLRSIETITYTTYPVALKFFKEHNKKVIVKPAQGTSSVNVFICRNEKQLMNAIDCCTAPGQGLTSGQILIQELIEGEEIVINTCSCHGIQKVTSV
ncbi:MAG: ATP-grasp domain-containing protein [Mycoplasmoidaceae bacterium]|nr:ATP-grasp domain-containing protein [Mycoplasmoidaceae bacterium]